VKNLKQPNIICTLPGELSSTMVVGAHFDMAERGMGVVDNWSGASLLPSIYQALALRPRRHTFIFVGFSGEELGLIGSRHFVKQLNREQIAVTRLMLDLDSLGMSSTKLWLNGSDRKLAEVLNGLAFAMKMPLQVVNTERIGTTDSEAFADKKIPTVSLHSITQENFRVLHSAQDNLDAVKMDDFYATYRVVCAYLTYLDAKLN
jgi:Zn-dependent M28 family amino/carboxypeptidase